MADWKKRVPENVEGDFFVDTTCIDCGTCRILAPENFAEAAEYSYVYAQPSSETGRRDASRALLSCPTGSIGTRQPAPIREAMSDFPLRLDDEVYYNGFTSASSFGGSSYFVRRAEGNWMVDSPRFLPHLVKAFEAMGGISTIFLTHQDDVADADKYAGHFGARRIIHRADLGAQPDAEIVLEGEDTTEFVPGFTIIPTPGHTRGHCVLLVDDRYLFTGDHLWGRGEGLGASRSVAWYSWGRQIESLRKLLDYRFEWVLPGHGKWLRHPSDRMHAELEALVARIG